MPSLILIGPPGAGKGTQKERIIKKYEMSPIVPGDLMRTEIKNKTDIGLQLKDYVTRGLLAPHEIAMQVVERKINEYKKQGIKDLLFDGFPREIEQAEALDEILKKKPGYIDFNIKCVLFFEVSDEIVLERIHKRALTSNRADDINDDIIKTRLDIFHKKMFLVVEKYEKLNLLFRIKGEGNENEVFDHVDKILSDIFKKRNLI